MPSRPIDVLLARADAFGVKPSGRGRWRMLGACHGAKRTLSVSIAEGDDGAALVHCFAGCSVEQILSTLGMQAHELFQARPAAPGDGRKPTPRPFSVIDLIAALSSELRVVWVLLADLAAGREATAADRRRAAVARDRCAALIEELRHVR